ncbi:hypothetical protein CYLTODRAFT_163916 [Cylindrobasidium torrendii FP15055 ss-10]|uniref:Uncharacterized protein n=1 Tax=Cylindrobasidium torrendii FP15055 ss-10 TaxID=1314674 RepID=A0A0D7AWQ8_9AGAR|nr:hypothetical protein CYLTODRAFT_163916 [Cylindrobasidium torrendii FP15055 ss-10]
MSQILCIWLIMNPAKCKSCWASCRDELHKMLLAGRKAGDSSLSSAVLRVCIQHFLPEFKPLFVLSSRPLRLSAFCQYDSDTDMRILELSP